MSRNDIAESTYEAGLGLNAIKREMGLKDGDAALATEQRIVAARDMMRRIDTIVAKGGASGEELADIREAAEKLNESTVCDKGELDWSESSIYASLPRMISALLRGK
jgi:hypothetical protein